MLSKSSSLSYEEIDNGEILIFDYVSGDTHILNPTAAMLFRLVDNINLTQLSDDFYCIIKEQVIEVPPFEVVLQDVQRMVSQFIEQKIVVKG